MRAAWLRAEACLPVCLPALSTAPGTGAAPGGPLSTTAGCIVPPGHLAIRGPEERRPPSYPAAARMVQD
jgi:hypothetical protein